MINLDSPRHTSTGTKRLGAFSLVAAVTLAGLTWQPASASAQEAVSAPASAEKPGLSFSIAGNLNVSSDLGERVFVNLGGPNVKLKVEDVFFGVSMFPSLRLTPDRVAPMLGGGPFVGWKHFQIVMPFYAIGSFNALKPTFGVGYIF